MEGNDDDRGEKEQTATSLLPAGRGSGLDIDQQRERRREKKVEDRLKRTV